MRTKRMSAYGPKQTCRKTQSMSLLGVKRTCVFAPHMSAFDPKQTLRFQQQRSGVPMPMLPWSARCNFGVMKRGQAELLIFDLCNSDQFFGRRTRKTKKFEISRDLFE
jgi:hypothetical protein